VFCQRCGTQNAQGDAFCKNCGAPLQSPVSSAVCGRCGTPAAAGQRFCRRCGAPLPGGPAPGALGPPVASQPRRGRRLFGCSGCLGGCVIVMLVGLALAAGGFVAFRTGALSVATVMNLLGLGPGDIEVDNFRDDAVQVSILRLDTARDSKPTPATLQIGSFNISTYSAQSRARYRVDFTAGGRVLGTCSLTMRSGDHYQFVALPSELVVNRANRPASAGADLIVDTSALCR
jgi:hypothetical protein